MINKQLVFRTAITASLLATIAGCSSGGGDERSKSSDLDDGLGGVNDPKLPRVDFPVLVRGELTEQNVESVISEVYRLNHYWLYKLRDELEDVNLELGSTIQDASFPNGSTDLSELCDRGGTYTAEFFNVTSLQDENGYRVYGPGDYLELDFAFCGAEFLHDSYYYSGTHRYDVLSGYYDGYEYLSTGTSVKETYIDRVLDFGTYNLSDFEDYSSFKNGALVFTLLDENTINVSGDRYEEKPTSVLYQEAYQIRDFSLSLTEIPYKWDWDGTYILQTQSAMQIGSLSLGSSYTMQVSDSVVFDGLRDDYKSGVLIVKGISAQVEITYQDSYLSYRLDEDGDGVYETESIVFYIDL